MRPPRARLLSFLACLALAAALPGCGQPDVGGSGRLVPVEGGGAGDHLVLEGTPYEMGWWHGHLLKDRIRALHEEWQRQAFALDGDLTSPATKERRAAALALVEPVLQQHLPEEVRREYDGLAAGCGLPVRTLLLTEMLTDILRFTEPGSPRLLHGQVGRTVLPVGGVDLTLDSSPHRTVLSTTWLWITRKHADGSLPTTVLAWPGGLGGIAAARADGLVAASVEYPLPPGREGLGGVPFRLSLRRAVERGGTPSVALASMSRTTGHVVLVADLRAGTGLKQLVALSSDEPKEAPASPVNIEGDYTGQPEFQAMRFEWSLRQSAVWVTSWPTSPSADAGRQLRIP